MDRHRLAINGLLSGMILLPLVFFIQLHPKAAPTARSFQLDLLITQLPGAPVLDQLSKINQMVIAKYVVKPGEDLWSICRRYKIDQYTIRSSNDLENQFPEAGSILRIPNHRGTLYVVEKPENLEAISGGFQQRKRLGPLYDREILEMNDFPMPDLKDPNRTFTVGTTLFLPEAFKPTGLDAPFLLTHLTSGFGMRRHPVLGITRPHKGLDLAMPYGTPVKASRAGVVTYAGWMGGYGNMVEVRHLLKNGHVRFTRYGHMSKIHVHVGQHVVYQQLIGNVGSTGISTGPHLHYEIRDESGEARNPGSKSAY